MQLTNRYNLPDAFVRAVTNDPYDSGDSDFTPSSLSTPPKAYALKKAFGDKIEVDVSSRVASIIGQGAHTIAERAARPGDICEKRFFTEVEVDGTKYTLSAQIDLYESDAGHLMDWKTTKAFAFSKKAGGGKKPEWIIQTNIGAELLRRHGFAVNKISIIAMLKDWDRRKASSGDHPESEVLQVEMPIWDGAKVMEYVEARIRELVQATPETECTDHWSGRRCASWCDASSVCSQYLQSQKTGIISADEANG